MPSLPPSPPSCCSPSAGSWVGADAHFWVGADLARRLAPHLALHAFVEALDADDDALVAAAAYGFDPVAGFDAEFYGAAFEADDLGGGGDAQSDRRRRHMADVEMDAEALMARRQEVFDGGERSRLDDVDHHRRRQHRDAAGADKRRGMFRADHDLRRADEAGRDAGQDRADAGRRRHGTLWTNMA